MADSNRTRAPRVIVARLAWLALTAGVASVSALIVANYAHERDQLAHRARLQLIWPDVAALPSRDRELLNALARHCGLARVPLDAAASMRCLKRAASDAAFVAPAGVDAAAELRRLLSDRPATAPAVRAPGPLA